jgi:hypothetical protein
MQRLVLPAAGAGGVSSFLLSYFLRAATSSTSHEQPLQFESYSAAAPVCPLPLDIAAQLEHFVYSQGLLLPLLLGTVLVTASFSVGAVLGYVAARCFTGGLSPERTRVPPGPAAHRAAVYYHA